MKDQEGIQGKDDNEDTGKIIEEEKLNDYANNTNNQKIAYESIFSFFPCV